MSAEQNGRPTEQEWAEAQAEGGLATLRPLIDREREAARAEGMVAVAESVLATLSATEWGGWGGSRRLTQRLRAALPADATEALALLKAEAWERGAGDGHGSPLTWFALRQVNPYRTPGGDS